MRALLLENKKKLFAEFCRKKPTNKKHNNNKKA
jgi:hypothetical protein